MSARAGFLSAVVADARGSVQHRPVAAPRAASSGLESAALPAHGDVQVEQASTPMQPRQANASRPPASARTPIAQGDRVSAEPLPAIDMRASTARSGGQPRIAEAGAPAVRVDAITSARVSGQAAAEDPARRSMPLSHSRQGPAVLSRGDGRESVPSPSGFQRGAQDVRTESATIEAGGAGLKASLDAQEPVSLDAHVRNARTNSASDRAAGEVPRAEREERLPASLHAPAQDAPNVSVSTVDGDGDGGPARRQHPHKQDAPAVSVSTADRDGDVGPARQQRPHTSLRVPAQDAPIASATTASGGGAAGTAREERMQVTLRAPMPERVSVEGLPPAARPVIERPQPRARAVTPQPEAGVHIGVIDVRIDSPPPPPPRPAASAPRQPVSFRGSSALSRLYVRRS